MSRGGLYLWRVRKPHAVFGLPIIGRHNGYGGMTNSFYHREGQHLRGSATYLKPAASWSDLRPKCWRFALPDWLFATEGGRKMVKVLETLLLAVTCPVYNVDQQPPWNMRKISRKKAAMMRRQRDDHGQMMFLARAFVRLLCWVAIATVGVLIYLGMNS